MKRLTEKAFAAVAFVTALATSLIVFPLILDRPAFAVDADGHDHMPLPSERIEARLAFIKTALNITDAQGPQWNALATVMRKQAKDQDAEITAMRAYRDQNFTAIDRIEHRQKALATRAAALTELLGAAKPLYAVLSDQQKQMADELLAQRMGQFDEPRRGPGPRPGGPDREP